MRLLSVTTRLSQRFGGLRNLMVSVVILFFLLCFWEIAVTIFNIKSYILPPPSSIFISLFKNIGIILKHLQTTGTEAGLALFLSILIGKLSAYTLILLPRIEKPLRPIITGFQSFPKEAIAPLLVIWFGFGITSKIVLATSIAFFPIFLSCIQGLKSVPRDVIYTMRSLGLSDADILLKVRRPYSRPYFYSGLRVSATLAIIGAVIGEFIGSSSGIGYLIQSANSQFSVDLVFASLFILAIAGIIIEFIITIIEAISIPWHDSHDLIHTETIR